MEAQQAETDGRYARALRRLAKRRRAIAEARPYVVAMVGLADSHVLSNGKMCYIHEDVHDDMRQRWLRILDLHNPSGQETVIDIPKLTAEAIPRSKNCQSTHLALFTTPKVSQVVCARSPSQNRKIGS